MGSSCQCWLAVRKASTGRSAWKYLRPFGFQRKAVLHPAPSQQEAWNQRQLTDQHLLICPCLYPGAVIGLIVRLCVIKAGLSALCSLVLSSFQLSVLIVLYSPTPRVTGVERPFGGMGGSWGGGKQKKRGESCGWEFPAWAESVVADSAGDQSSEFQGFRPLSSLVNGLQESSLAVTNFIHNLWLLIDTMCGLLLGICICVYVCVHAWTLSIFLDCRQNPGLPLDHFLFRVPPGTDTLKVFVERMSRSQRNACLTLLLHGMASTSHLCCGTGLV